MKRPFRSIRVAVFFVILIASSLSAFAYTGEELASGAQVSVAKARAIALKAVPGDIIDEELESEEGGSGLRYTFNIKRGTETYEVGIDARTGAVLENIVEGKGPH
jgi:uncharacterized membrane protein YkoI